MTIRLNGIRDFTIGDTLPIRVDADNIHLFDPSSEKRLETA